MSIIGTSYVNSTIPFPTNVVFQQGIDQATGASSIVLLALLSITDSATGSSSTPSIFILASDEATGSESPLILLSSPDSAEGLSIGGSVEPSLLAHTNNTDDASASEVHSLVANIFGDDLANGDSTIISLLADLQNSDSALGEAEPIVITFGDDSASGNTPNIYTIPQALDEALGESSITRDNIMDILFNIEGELDRYIDLEGEYTLQELLDALFDMYEDLEGEL